MLLAPILGAADYYVDYDSGSDSNAGTSTGAPWKHSPGDSNAAGNAASTTLAAGDTVFFKGGVDYRGQITISSSGTSGNPITFDGSGSTWGTGAAIMNGATVLAGSWTQCANAADCWDNPNWQNIWYRSIPAGMTAFTQMVIDGDTQTHTAQDPNPSDKFILDLMSEWYDVTAANHTATSLTDATVLNQTDANYWDDAWVGIWGSPNVVNFREVTTFTPATDTITFSTFTVDGGDAYFSMFNHPSLIDSELETCVSPGDSRLYVWPPGGTEPSGTWEVAELPWAFLASNRSYITIEGFTFKNYFSDVGAVGSNGLFSGSTVDNITINNTTSRFIRCMDRDFLFTLGGGDGSAFTNNTMEYCMGGGPLVGFASPVVSGNTFNTLTGTGIYMNSATNGLISGNTLTNVNGTHSNGITVYGQGVNDSEDCIVERNIVIGSNSLMTFELCQRLTVRNNLIIANGSGSINFWAGGGNADTDHKFYNNTFGGYTDGGAGILRVGAAALDGDTFTIRNNIIDGGGTYDAWGTRSNNIYTSWATSWSQDTGAGGQWSYQTGESFEVEGDLFVNAGGSDPADWHLKAGSPAIGAGFDLSGSFTDDIEGNTRSGWDIGAYAYEVISGTLNVSGTATIGP